jgi:hypothetical protein
MFYLLEAAIYLVAMVVAYALCSAAAERREPETRKNNTPTKLPLNDVRVRGK